MKKSSSVFPAILVISILCFWMSPTSTKNRVLKSIETLFNLKDGSLIQAYHSIETNKNSGTSESEHSQEAKDYFNEVCLGNEFGMSSEEAFKWEEDVKIYVSGYKPDYMMEELNDIVSDLNNLIDPINIEIVSNKNEANTFLFLGSKDDFINNYSFINPNDLKNSWGFFEIHPNPTQSYLFVEMIDSDGYITSQKSILREEVTQSLGLCNDSKKYPNSIFYQDSNDNTEYSELDKEIIQMLYNN